MYRGGRSTEWSKFGWVTLCVYFLDAKQKHIVIIMNIVLTNPVGNPEASEGNIEFRVG